MRLHLLHWPIGNAAPSAAWIMEVVDVYWEPPEGWSGEIERAVTSPGAEGEAVTFEVGNDPQSAVLDVVARSAKGTAQLITDRHRVASLLEAWAIPAGESHSSDHETSSEEAKAAVLFAIESHFATSGDQVDAVDSEHEPGAEILVHVEAGPQRYIGTVARHGRIQLSHVVDRTER